MSEPLTAQTLEDLRLAYGSHADVQLLLGEVVRLRALVGALLETGRDEPLMDMDISRTDPPTFWFCGGTRRAGHEPDCPWKALIAEMAPAAVEQEPRA